MRVTMEAVLVVSLAVIGGVSARPQQITQEVLLTPFNIVRDTGNTVLSTGQQVVNSVPEAVNVVSDTAVDGVNIVPNTVNTVSDFTVDSINSVPSNTIRFVNSVPGALVR